MQAAGCQQLVSRGRGLAGAPHRAQGSGRAIASPLMVATTTQQQQQQQQRMWRERAAALPPAAAAAAAAAAATHMSAAAPSPSAAAAAHSHVAAGIQPQQQQQQHRRRRVSSTVACRSSTSDSTGLHRPIHEELVRTVYIAETNLPTRHGTFRLRGYKHSIDGGKTFVEPTAIICGQVEGKEDVAVRVHDACFTSEVLGSLKCDCAEQLQMAMEYIRDHPPGIVIYLWQEGRGIGLANKIAAYKLQEQGLDTVDANRALGLPDDLREYTSVRNILKELGVRSIRLITNNPRKIGVLTELGVKITGRIPVQIQAGDHNKGYLEAKATRMEHQIDKAYWSSTAGTPESGRRAHDVVERVEEGAGGGGGGDSAAAGGGNGSGGR